MVFLHLGQFRWFTGAELPALAQGSCHHKRIFEIHVLLLTKIGTHDPVSSRQKLFQVYNHYDYVCLQSMGYFA